MTLSIIMSVEGNLSVLFFKLFEFEILELVIRILEVLQVAQVTRIQVISFKTREKFLLCGREQEKFSPEHWLCRLEQRSQI